jgi:hypothetical protein
MAYLIFLKYLRSLEEFRKNPHVKIPPKSPRANFQSLGIFKNLIFIRKGISAHPAQPRLRQPATPRRTPAPRSAQATLAYLPKGVFSYTLRTPAETPSISHVTAMWGPLVSSIPFPRRLTIAASPHRLLPPRTAPLHPRMPLEPLLAPPSSPPP